MKLKADNETNMCVLETVNYLFFLPKYETSYNICILYEITDINSSTTQKIKW